MQWLEIDISSIIDLYDKDINSFRKKLIDISSITQLVIISVKLNICLNFFIKYFNTTNTQILLSTTNSTQLATIYHNRSGNCF